MKPLCRPSFSSRVFPLCRCVDLRVYHARIRRLDGLLLCFVAHHTFFRIHLIQFSSILTDLSDPLLFCYLTVFMHNTSLCRIIQCCRLCYLIMNLMLRYERMYYTVRLLMFWSLVSSSFWHVYAIRLIAVLNYTPSSNMLFSFPARCSFWLDINEAHPKVLSM